MRSGRKCRETALGKKYSEIVQEITQEKAGGMEHLDAIGHLPPISQMKGGVRQQRRQKG